MPMLRFDPARYIAVIRLNLMIVVLCTVSVALAAEGNKTGLPAIKQGLVNSPPSAVYVHPTSAPINVPRTIFFVDSRLTGCMVGGLSFDASALHSQNLVAIQFDLKGGICGVPPPSFPTYEAFTVTPSKAGTLTVRVVRDGKPEIAESLVTASPSVHSTRNVNGMWFDSATNGSGIAMHHSRASDNVFGAWYLYNVDGSTRWYTLQNAYWRNNGDVLEGLLYVTSGNCLDNALVACPAKGKLRTMPQGSYVVPNSYPAGTPFFDSVIARFTFTSDTAARAEVVDFAGNVLFVSQLVRLPL